MYHKDVSIRKTSSQVVRHYNGIDLFKFILSFFVVAIHFYPLTSVNRVANYLLVNYLARVAVPFYFVVSGFLCFRKTDYENIDISIPVQYAVKIIKLYCIWSLIYFIPSFTDLLKVSGDVEGSLLIWARNFLFSGSYRQLWYLNATAFSILFVSFLLCNRWHIIPICLMSFLLYCVGLLGQSYFGLLRVFIIRPEVWSILDSLERIIVTTRDGLFEGVMFVSLGLLFAYKPIVISIRATLIGFILSMVALLCEVYLTHKLGWVKEYDMYVMLIPASFFLFYLSTIICTLDNPIYKKLRIYSVLTFYIHTLIGWGLKYFIAFIRWFIVVPEINSLLLYLIVLAVSYFFAFLIIRLSRVSKFRFIAVLYQ